MRAKGQRSFYAWWHQALAWGQQSLSRSAVSEALEFIQSRWKPDERQLRANSPRGGAPDATLNRARSDGQTETRQAGDLANTEAAQQRVQDFFKHNPVRESWPWRHWNAHPIVANAINRRVTGSAAETPVSALAKLLPSLGLQLPVANAASLGCGRGRLDRGLYRHGIVQSLIGFDMSPESIEAAAYWAASAGITGFEYKQADLNKIELEPGRFDLIVAEMSLHHTYELERLFEIAARSLRPRGLLFIDEYVGPTRFQWTDQQMLAVNGFLTLLPPEYRMTPDGAFKPLIERLPESFFEEVDPSEAIRSGSVLPCLEEHFEVLWKRPYGGAILHPLLHDIAYNFREGELFADAFLASAITMEETMMATRQLDSDFVALVASPRLSGMRA